MKTLLLLLLVLSVPAQAERPWLLPPSFAHSPMYWGNMGLHAWDTYQTCQHGFDERNMKWLLGKSPSCDDTIVSSIGGAVVLHFVDRLVMHRWPRAGRALRHSFGGYRAKVIDNNRRNQ